MVLWNMDHVMEHLSVTKLANVVYFCTSRDASWTNQDHVIQTVI